MIIVGITGGIGSGKSAASTYFKRLGIPVYIADDRAKVLMNDDVQVRSKIIHLLGKEAYTNQSLNRSFVAHRIFSNPDLLQQINQIVHPAVHDDFIHWKTLQAAPYVLEEAAILIESGAYKRCNKIIVVTAPESLRIQRVMARDQLNNNDVRARMTQQITETERLQYADYIIQNEGDLIVLNEQVAQIHQELLKDINKL